ncbi:MAG: DUF3352 domain-containing protein [Planctomycetes bacterium]|nr:DUF3352 domain-containing protein [Planctomycetota bacterium]
MSLRRVCLVFVIGLLSSATARALVVLPPIRTPVAEEPAVVSEDTSGAPLPEEAVDVPLTLIQSVTPETAKEERPIKTLRAEEILPESLLAFVSIEDPGTLWKEVKKLKIWGLLSEPLIGDFFDSYFKKFESRFKAGEADPRTSAAMLGAAGLSPSRMLELFTGQVALAACRPEKNKENYYLVIQLQQGRQSIHDMVEEFSSQVETRHPDVIVSPTLFNDMDVTNFELPDGSHFGYTYIENLLVVGKGKGAIEYLISEYQDPGRRAFIASRQYQQVYRSLGEGAMVFYIIDFPAVAQLASASGKFTLGPSASEDAKKLFSDLRSGDVMNIGLISGSAFPMAGGVRDRIQIDALDRTKGFAYRGKTWITEGELSYGAANYASIDSVMYTSVQNCQNIVTQQKKTADNDKQLASAVFEFVEQATGLDIEGDLLPLVKGEFATAITTSPGRPYPDMIAIAELKSTEDANKKFNVIKGKLGPQWQLSSIGTKSSMLHFKLGEKGPLATLNYTPGFAIDGKYLIAGSSTDAIRKAIRQNRFAGSSSIQQSTSFKLATGDMPQNLNSLFYLDLGRAVDMGYNTLLPVLSQMPQMQKSLSFITTADTSRLPTPESVTQHLVPVAIGTRLDNTTLYIDAYSPTGTLTIGLAMLAKIAVGKSGAGPGPEATETNIRKLGVALHEYAADFDRFPIALSELFPIYVQNLEYFTSPSGKREVTGREHIDSRGDFVYVTGVQLNDLSDTIVCYSKKYVYENGNRTVLYLNNTARTIEEAAFKSAMARQGSTIVEE